MQNPNQKWFFEDSQLETFCHGTVSFVRQDTIVQTGFGQAKACEGHPNVLLLSLSTIDWTFKSLKLKYDLFYLY